MFTKALQLGDTEPGLCRFIPYSGIRNFVVCSMSSLSHCVILSPSSLPECRPSWSPMTTLRTLPIRYYHNFFILDGFWTLGWHEPDNAQHRLSSHPLAPIISINSSPQLGRQAWATARSNLFSHYHKFRRTERPRLSKCATPIIKSL